MMNNNPEIIAFDDNLDNNSPEIIDGIIDAPLKNEPNNRYARRKCYNF